MMKKILILLILICNCFMCSSCQNRNTNTTLIEEIINTSNDEYSGFHNIKMHPNQTAYIYSYRSSFEETPFSHCEGENLDYFSFAYNHKTSALLVHCEKKIEKTAHISKVIYISDTHKITVNVDITINNDENYNILEPNFPNFYPYELDVCYYANLFFGTSSNNIGNFYLYIDEELVKYGSIKINKIYIDGCDNKIWIKQNFLGGYLHSNDKNDDIYYHEFPSVTLPLIVEEPTLIIMPYERILGIVNCSGNLVFEVEYKGENYIISRPFSVW